MSHLTADPSDGRKAIPCSVSFLDIGLYHWAKNYGRSLTPVQSASTVICTAIAEYRQRNDPVLDDETAAAFAQVQAATSKDPALAGDLLKFIRDRKRTKRTPR